MSMSESPNWLPVLLTTRFYGPCPVHPSLRRNELNLFDTNAMRKICQHCQPVPPSPPARTTSLYPAMTTEDTAPPTLLHISRYMYHDVVLLREASAWFDVTHIQPYLNNGHRVLYLDRSLQPKSRLAPNAASCKVCDRTLQHPYLFCSLRCKLRPNLLAGDEENEEVAAETCPNTPQSSVGSVAPSSPGRLVLPPASTKRSPLSHGELTRLLPCGEALPTIVPPRKIVAGGVPKKSTASSPKPVVCVQPTTRNEQPSTPPASPLCDLASDIRKSRRKGHPMHSPVAGPKTFMLLRHTLQPLLL